MAIRGDEEMHSKDTGDKTSAIWTIVDQAVVSAGNFLLSVVLARHLPPAEFATFALIYLSILACNTLHGGLVVYWVIMAGAKCTPIQLRSLLTTALTITMALPLLFAPFAWGVAHALGKTELWGWLLVAILAWQLQETTRRGMLCQLRALPALAGDVISYAGQVALVVLFHVNDVASVLQIVAGTSICAALLQALQIGFAPVHPLEAWKTFRESLKLTKFAVGANFIAMVALQVPGWLLLRLGGKWDVACFQAMLSIMNASNPIFFALSNFVIPAVARAHESLERARSVAVKASLQISSPLLLFFSAVIAAPHLVLRLAYGKTSPYLGEAPLLRVFVLSVVLQWVASCIGAYEGGRGRTRSYFFAQLFNLVSLLTAGWFFIANFGIRGAVGSAILASGVRAAVTWWLSRGHDRVELAAVRAA
jgi:O-antigen/teichoic acid export membrane protein